MFDFFSTLGERSENVSARRMLRGLPHQTLYRTEEKAVYRPYFSYSSPDRHPVWEFRRNSPTYEVLTQEFDSLWSANEPML